MKNFFASLFEILEIAAIAIITVVIVRTFLLQPFLVNGASMEPNFASGDYLLVDELTYHLRVPERGEVIVFRYPGDETTFYIKRIIGLPGETVFIENNDVTIFNTADKKHPLNNDHVGGLKLDESFLPESSFTRCASDKTSCDFTLDNSHYFVMGDNRVSSWDSRNWGAVAQKELIGIVRLRLWPVEKVSIFQGVNLGS